MMWNFLYWVLLVIAVVLLLRGLLWDRAGFRGRAERRCRRCWYDLTGSDDVSRGAVVCPECGKGHKTKRSMRKTRRGKRWIAAAVAVWLMAYGASVTPEVQKNGWGAAVPRVVLVASLPFLSEEPGSGLSSQPFPPTATVTISRYEQLVLREVNRALMLSMYNPANQRDRFGWVSARLAFLLARLESESDLCDGTSVKGTVYQSLLTSLVRQGRAYDHEEGWARAQNEIAVEFNRGFGPDEPVTGRVRMNTLVRDVETVQFGDPYSLYTIHAMPNRSGFGSGSGLRSTSGTAEERLRAYIEANRWAQLWNPKDESGFSPFESYSYSLGNGQLNGDGTGRVHIGFRFGRYMRNGEGQVDRDAAPEILYNETVIAEYAVDTGRSIQQDASQELKDWIEQSFTARLCVEYSTSEQSWVPVIQLKPQTRDAWDGGALVFGGYVRVLEVPVNGDEYPQNEYMRGNHVWWRWAAREPANVEEVTEMTDEDGSPFTVHVLQDTRPYLQSRNAMSMGRTGQLSPNAYVVGRRPDTSTKMVVRIQANLSTQMRLGGLWGDCVYTGELEFELPKWTKRQFEQFIVNGVAPEHAFPGRD